MNPITTGKATLLYLLFLPAFFLMSNISFAQLNVEWDRTFGGSGWEELNGMVLTDDYGYLFCGTTFSNISFDVSEPNRGLMGGDFWVVKTDTAGTKLWEHRYGGDNWDRLWAVINTSDGGYLLGGESNSNAGNPFPADEKSEDSRGGLDYWVVKIDAMGQYQWDKTIGGAGQDTLFGLAEVNDGYLLAGFSGSQPSGDKTAHTMEMRIIGLLKLIKITEKSCGTAPTAERNVTSFLHSNNCRTGLFSWAEALPLCLFTIPELGIKKRTFMG